MDINGHTLVVAPSSFQEAMNLKRAIAKALMDQKNGLGLSGIKIDEEDPLKTDLPIDSLLQTAMSVATDPEVIDCLFVCASHALIDDQKIDRDFFEDVNKRSYFYPIMLEVMKQNLSPFFENLSSLFEKFAQTMRENSQPSQ